MQPASIAAALAIGVSLGLLGGGGSILTVPALVYLAGLAPAEATTSSLVVVGVTSLSGALQHFFGGRVQLKAALLFAATGVPASALGTLAWKHIPQQWLLPLFACVMIAAGLSMIFRKQADVASDVSPLAVALAGFGVGLVTGVLGVGGGFLIVPALVLFAGVRLKDAVGTSLVVIALNCAGGFVARVSAAAPIDWKLTLAFCVVAIAGSFLGARLVRHIPHESALRLYGVFVC